jgi:1-acyl-sn-glycerol-3-phosphate acyltransferase
MSSDDTKNRERVSEQVSDEVPSPEAEAEVSEEERREQLVAELDDLIERLRAISPEYEPPPFSRRRLKAVLEEGLTQYPKDLQVDLRKRLRTVLNDEWLDPATWKGVWYMVNYTLQYNADLVKRRFTGEYDTDEWGLDWEFLDVVRPFFAFLYKIYWRVETSGIEHIPIEGRTVLVANHSGQLPWDGTMITTAVLTEHPAQRLVRPLFGEWFASWPFVSAWLVRMGQSLATVDNGTRLLEQEKVVAVFPEGNKGLSKTFRERYRLARFDEMDFVKMALATQSPVVPISVVGAEETYLALAQSQTMSRLTRWPYFPISPTFPWLGLLGLTPLPTKWAIDFGRPIAMDGYGPDDADNLVLVSQITDQVRNTIQDMVQRRLAQRRSVILG